MSKRDVLSLVKVNRNMASYLMMKDSTDFVHEENTAVTSTLTTQASITNEPIHECMLPRVGEKKDGNCVQPCIT